MDQLVKVREAHQKEVLPQNIYDTINERFELVTEGIARIEKASGAKYPISYVEPSAILTSSSDMSFQYGILFARTIPVFFEEKFQVMIQISAPLVAFGLKGTIHAILAHEFLHYIELIRKISKMELLSDEISSNLFENTYADSTRLFEPRAVFSDQTLLTHITKKFPTGFKDYKLEDKTEKLWIAKQLPVTNVALDSNTVKLSAESLSKVTIDPMLLQKILEYEEKESKLRKKKLY
ncbi:hypothetical protein [Candidatus Nitrosotenuis aquarius]|uniref:hypothetical protein n=1 Tax=Candidatus Nitrosotenuis aquarius TaxID=1846278 RepID=UPI000C1EF488|nr:hypothetical protein [Candidatus Nitrosotenuis aquarius]